MATTKIARRREIFTTLVQLQDAGWPTVEAEEQVMTDYGITRPVLNSIIAEGFRKNWIDQYCPLPEQEGTG
jgi:hypothetical protein